MGATKPRSLLNQKAAELGTLHPDVIRLSQKLDTLIIAAQKKMHESAFPYLGYINQSLRI